MVADVHEANLHPDDPGPAPRAEGSLSDLVERSVAGMGYEFVELERGAGGVLRVFIDAGQGIRIEDCERVSHQLSRVLEVEQVDYQRLEISSPGLDRPLKRAADFHRFAGARVALKLRQPFEGQRNFEGLLQVDEEGRFGLALVPAPEPKPVGRGKRGRQAPKAAAAAAPTDEAVRILMFSLDEVERARLVPEFNSRRAG